MDVNAIIYCGSDKEKIKLVETNAALNVKRAIVYSDTDWGENTAQGPYHILKTQETKTTWHPVGF
jgi:hypothetical protein